MPKPQNLKHSKGPSGGRKKNNFHKTQISRAHKRKANKQTTHTHTKFVRKADKSELPKGIPQECLRDRVCPDLSPVHTDTKEPVSQPANQPVSCTQIETLSSSSLGTVLEQEAPAPHGQHHSQTTLTHTTTVLLKAHSSVRS